MIGAIRPAARSNAKPLIGIYAESGKGKTYSSLVLARGFIGPTGEILMIETEGGRGEAFSDPTEYPEVGGYKVIPITESFAPTEYGKAITAAEQAKPDALIIDSASHEWEGAGGVLSMAAANQASGTKGVQVWQRPKMDHQTHFMLRLMQTPIPLVIVCMRAKYPMKEVKKPNGQKEWQRSEELEPKQSDDILFEMFLHGWIDGEHRFHVTKATTRSIAEVFGDMQRIDAATGQRLAAMGSRASPAPATEAEARSWAPAEGAQETAEPSHQATYEPAGEMPPPAEFKWMAANGTTTTFLDIKKWVVAIKKGVAKITEVAQIDLARRNNGAHLSEIQAAGGIYAAAVTELEDAFKTVGRRLAR